MKAALPSYNADPANWHVKSWYLDWDEEEPKEHLYDTIDYPWIDYFVWEKAVKSLEGDGAKFELFLISLLMFLGFPVKKTRSSHDGGADVLVTTPAGKIAIQAKLWNVPVGPKAVMEAEVGKRWYRADHAAVVSPSGFTKTAVDRAWQMKVRLFKLDMHVIDPSVLLINHHIACNPDLFVASFLEYSYPNYDDDGRIHFANCSFAPEELWPYDSLKLMTDAWTKSSKCVVQDHCGISLKH